ncbi:enoyl-CoA hydratase/isomerase family protein [Hyphococcus sp.]|jgi:enoyl-CoA hydratase/carnithine racemase|uniref:enoyl-CoA hydratase/isomerase family protein n=1 Tax=Hyphococcus sp. TaxID=2038636 RepID=UPI003D134E65
MSEPLVKSRIEDGVAEVTLNRPDALNAFTPDLLKALIAAIGEAESEARVIVLAGEGRAFSAGVDLKLLQGATFKEGKVDDVFDNLSITAIDSVRHCPVPVIAKVHGFCFTGALELALQADFILTAADAKFGDTHAKWGLRPSWGMSQNLARAVGVRKARELSFTAKTFTGAEAAQWGLANAAYPDKDALDAETAACAAAIAAASTGAIAAYKDLYRFAEENPALEDALAEEQRRDYPQITDTMDRLKGFQK